jgi:diguanylate cyclase (GGDEF)-like protein
MAMRLLRGIRARRTVLRRLPLMLTFGVISLVLTVAVGLALGSQIHRMVERRSVQSLTQSTRSAVAIAMSTIVTGVTYGRGETPMNTVQREAQVKVISSVSKVLVANSETVVVEGLLATGMVVGGAGERPVGTMTTLDADFRAALAGQTLVRTLNAADGAARTAFEQQVLQRHGRLLKFEQGVRLTAGGPIVGVVRTYTPLRFADSRAAADTRSILWMLAFGLIVFWGVLFRLVWGASRIMKWQSKANRHMASHDSLTGLPNRTLLRQRTNRAVRAAGRNGRRVGLLLMDLDRFKEVNETLGHHYGDLLLHQVSDRLRQELRVADTVARLGGDEFVVLLPDISSVEETVRVAQKLNLALRQPFLLDGIVVDVACSTGIVTTPQDGEDFDQLLQHADIAMYAAKRDCLEIVVYTAEMDSYSRDRLTLLAELRSALEHPEQIVLHYQPQADLGSGAIVGVEALVRWQHPEQGLLAPATFIELAEQTGIIRPLTWLVLRCALEQNRRWADDGLRVQVSVNLSARCLLDNGFCERLVALLAETGVPPARLKLELTESAIMADPDRSKSILEEVASYGIGVSIDDFGTGYSSMAYLKNLPVTEIKIDRVFIAHMDTDDSDAAIVRSCLDLARNLNLTVVAEGVETAAVRQLLQDLGCDTLQGYLLSRPLSPASLEGWLRRYSPAIAMPRSQQFRV